MEQARERSVDILVVEDNPADVGLLREAFRESRVPHRFHVAQDGEEALLFLRRQNGRAGAVRPDLILLDLNLPRKGGREVLADIKRDPELLDIPVIVLTTSLAQSDVQGAYAYHANCYVQKPMTLDEFLGVVRAIEEFWLLTARLPRD